MSMIEGIGDEVLQFFTVVIIVVIALLAWWSTNITEGPLIRTVLILERRSRGTTTNDSGNHQQQSITSSENNIDTGQSNPTGIQELVEAETVSNCRNSDNKEESESSSSLLLPANQPVAAVQLDGGNGDSQSREQIQSQPNVPQVQGENNESTAASVDSDSSVLRQRRLAFFQSRGPTLLESSTSSEGPGEMPATTIEDNEDQDEEEELSAGSQDHIRIRLKYLNDDQIVVEGRLQEQLGDFKRYFQNFVYFINLSIQKKFLETIMRLFPRITTYNFSIHNRIILYGCETLTIEVGKRESVKAFDIMSYLRNI